MRQCRRQRGRSPTRWISSNQRSRTSPGIRKGNKRILLIHSYMDNVELLIQKWAVGHTRCSHGSATTKKLTLAQLQDRTGLQFTSYHDKVELLSGYISGKRSSQKQDNTILTARHPGKVGRQWYRAKAKSSARPPRVLRRSDKCYVDLRA
ncbi:hypothetical protein FGSG_12708 [Fusarium graminearum PH-1]|uniref:Chromosome 3, complete genome n=1 Tax=Gibberella zeae (strain ATCC MYA-4620 / CBS 123657 / FGSC 9075 / NRRL 31084 / PH-1) TaxID=229533 RepID=I1S785_GIBZE|nr:hypothetical protein FGSG_12708 [Fusarium graminearum PH-1]ESU11245.1 hypothetical protein FGSG_12708 [Fusarium graminearum PH-1]CEF88277.1 unnamed protein product [Fusarium graminearum]|eukprot:XP_011323821.1 hypothetical protein FGSG_12708 [Fusarium graminearum PH-1]